MHSIMIFIEIFLNFFFNLIKLGLGFLGIVF